MKIGIAILSFMAALWAVGALYMGHAASWAYPGAVVVAFIPLLLITGRGAPKRTREEARRIGRVVGFATIFEAMAIVGGAEGAAAAGRPDLLVSVVAGAVALHFFPLARWMPQPRYYLTGSALLAAACAGVVLPVGYRDVLVAGAAVLSLWATALSLTFSLAPSAAQAS